MQCTPGKSNMKKRNPERLNKPRLEPLPEGQCSCNLLSDLFEHMGFHPGASTFMSHPGPQRHRSICKKHEGNTLASQLPAAYAALHGYGFCRTTELHVPPHWKKQNLFSNGKILWSRLQQCSFACNDHLRVAGQRVHPPMWLAPA